MARFKKIYSDSEEKYLKGYVVYSDEDDGYVYSDSTCTTKVDCDTLFNMFVKGMIIVVDGVYYNPVCFSKSGTVGTITVSGDGETYQFVSKEYVAAETNDG